MHLVKYPPIQGGVSAWTYWFVRKLGILGVKNIVISNNLEVENIYRMKLSFCDLPYYKPENVQIFSTTPLKTKVPIPFSQLYVLKIMNKALQVYDTFSQPDIIHSYYFYPYGASAILTKLIINKPVICSFAGSDYVKLRLHHELDAVTHELLKNVDVFLGNKLLAKKYSKRCFNVAKPLVDTKVFSPNIKLNLKFIPEELLDEEVPIILVPGKISYNKGVFQVAKAANLVAKTNDFRLVYVGHGEAELELKELIRSSHLLKDRTLFLDPVPPWRMPHLIKLATIVVHAQYQFPVRRHFPSLPFEAMAMERIIMCSKEIIHIEKYINHGKEGFLFNPGNVRKTADLIRNILLNYDDLADLRKAARKKAEKLDNTDIFYNKFINFLEEFV